MYLYLTNSKANTHVSTVAYSLENCTVYSIRPHKRCQSRPWWDLYLSIMNTLSLLSLLLDFSTLSINEKKKDWSILHIEHIFTRQIRDKVLSMNRPGNNRNSTAGHNVQEHFTSPGHILGEFSLHLVYLPKSNLERILIWLTNWNKFI